MAGVVQPDGNMLRVASQDGKWSQVRADDVESIFPSNVSIMPEGVDKQLAPDVMRDLLTFLLTPPPHMSTDLAGAPEPRSLNEVRAVLAGAEKPTVPFRPLHVVLVAGRKDHGPGEHDYPAWLNVWSSLLEASENVTVSECMEWPDQEAWAKADAIVFFQQGTWNDQRAADIDAFLDRGGGLSFIHYAVDGGPDPQGFAKRIGLAWQGGFSQFRHGELDLTFDSEHAITRNFDRLHLVDESYWNLVGAPERIHVLAQAVEDNSPQPLVWCREQGNGRIFVSIPGHFSWTFDDPLFRILLFRGMAWTAKEPVDRFNDVVEYGARIKN